jgi:hypothetical protein
VERWLAELPDGDWKSAGRLSAAVVAVAGRARRTAAAQGASPGEIAFASVLSRSGRWIVLHGASLVSAGRRRVAAIPAHPARIAPLLMSACPRRAGLDARPSRLGRDRRSLVGLPAPATRTLTVVLRPALNLTGFALTMSPGLLIKC